MLSPLVSWIMSSPTSSSSSSDEDDEEEESLDIDNTIDESDHENDIVVDHDQHIDKEDIPGDEENDHFVSSCDVDDTIPLAVTVPEASPAVTVALPATDERSTIPAAAITATIVTRSKRQRTTDYSGIVRQYQRLWTKRDEIELLKGYLDYKKQNKGAMSSLQNDVALFYDDVRNKLNAGFNMNQLVDKLRRLKRKHKVALDNGSSGKVVSFKNPQDEAIYEISNKLWGNDTDQGDKLDLDGGGSGGGGDDDNNQMVTVKIEQVEDYDAMERKAMKRYRLREHKGDDDVATSHIQGFIEQTMKSCFSPLMKEVLEDAQDGPPKQVELLSSEAGDEEWRRRRISELEVYLNRLELLQDQIKAKLEVLRSNLG